MMTEYIAEVFNCKARNKMVELPYKVHVLKYTLSTYLSTLEILNILGRHFVKNFT